MHARMNEAKSDGVRKRPLTMVDIAKIAGVSIATVSRVLNNSKSVKNETKKQVLKVIEEVGYEPNEIARELVTNTSRVIGLLIPDIMNNYYAEIISGIDEIATKKGFTLLLYITNEDPKKTVTYINEMIRRRVDGLVLLSIILNDNELIKKMKRSAAVVSVEADIDGIDRIGVDNEKGTYEVIRHLLNYGHKKIGFLGYQFHHHSLGQRLNGFKRAITDYGIEIQDEYIIEREPTGNPGYEMAKHILDLPEPPTAIHCMNEYIAEGVYLAVRERGMRIPEDISISSFDGLSISRIMYPRLTTAAMPIRQMGELAMEILFKNIEQRSAGVCKQIIVPVEFIPGESTIKV